VGRLVLKELVLFGAGHAHLEVLRRLVRRPLPATGLGLDAEGFIEVSETLQSVAHVDVAAAGDIAAVRGQPRPRSGVYAVRPGPPLATNVARLVTGPRPLSYRPQRAALALITTGERHAVGARNGLTLGGPGSGGSRT
jgi:selenide, water dikinase